MPGWYKACGIGKFDKNWHFWLVYSSVQFAVPADWEAPGWVLLSKR